MALYPFAVHEVYSVETRRLQAAASPSIRGHNPQGPFFSIQREHMVHGSDAHIISHDLPSDSLDLYSLLRSVWNRDRGKTVLRM